MDLIARQNIQSPNFLLTMKPADKVKFLLWWYIFHLEESRDALYNVAGAPIRVDATGASGRDVGQELDLLWQVTLTPRSDVVFGYSHFFAGDFIAATGNPSDADFYYTQYSFRF